MKWMRCFSMVKTLVLGLLMAGLCPGLTHAQEPVTGKFTLPFQARWGQTILPAGDYSLTVPSLTLWGFVIVRREPQGNTVALIRADAWQQIDTSDSSQLIFEQRGEESIVRSLYLKDKGYKFTYTVHERKGKIAAREPKAVHMTQVSKTMR
jgi:hypothetical protein